MGCRSITLSGLLFSLAIATPALAGPTKVHYRALCQKLLSLGKLDLGLESELIPSNPHPNEPGLRISHDSSGHKIGYDHEIASSVRYARLIHQGPQQETLVLIPEYQKQATPGFDGIIFDNEGDAVANYSLKSILTGHNARKTAITALEDALRYSTQIDSWIPMFRLWKRDKRGFRGSIKLSSEKQRHQFNDTLKWTQKIMTIFGFPFSKTGRKSRIVVDITDQATAKIPNRGHLFDLIKRVKDSNGVIESVTFLKNSQYVKVTAKGFSGGTF